MLSTDDHRLIYAASIERKRLRRELAQLSDRALADKFDCSVMEIKAVLRETRVYGARRNEHQQPNPAGNQPGRRSTVSQ